METWSPLRGRSPSPIRRSKALTPPELSSSVKSVMADFDQQIEELLLGYASREKAVVITERDIALLLDNSGEEEAVAQILFD